MDVDMRSESCAELKKVNDAFLALVAQAVDEENGARSTREGKIEADPKLIGDRPCGETPPTSPIVQTAAAVVKAFGLTPRYSISSTDSNVPMNMGIPAVTIGRGGPGGRGARARRVDRRRAQGQRRSDQSRDDDHRRRRQPAVGVSGPVRPVEPWWRQPGGECVPNPLSARRR